MHFNKAIKCSLPKENRSENSGPASDAETMDVAFGTIFWEFKDSDCPDDIDVCRAGMLRGRKAAIVVLFM